VLAIRGATAMLACWRKPSVQPRRAGTAGGERFVPRTPGRGVQDAVEARCCAGTSCPRRPGARRRAGRAWPAPRDEDFAESGRSLNVARS